MLPSGPRGGPILHGARARTDHTYRVWKGAIDVLWEDKYKALLEEQAACAHHEEAACRQQLLVKQATRACQQKAAALRQRLCLLSKSVAERQRSAELAAQQKQAATRTIFLWLRRRRLFVWIDHRTLRRQQREAALAHLRYEQDCCRHVAVAQKHRHHEEAAECAAALAARADASAKLALTVGPRA